MALDTLNGVVNKLQYDYIYIESYMFMKMQFSPKL